MPNPMMDDQQEQQGIPPIEQPMDEGKQDGGLLSKGKDPKLQQQYDMFMAFGFKIIHDQKFSDQVAQTAASLKDPKQLIDFLANITLSVVQRVEDAAKQQGQKIADNVKLNAGNQLLGEVISITEIASKHRLSKEQKAQAFSLMVSTYLDRAVKTGKLTPQQVQQMAQQVKQTPAGQKFAQTHQEIMSKKRGGQMGGGPPQQGQPGPQTPMPPGQPMGKPGMSPGGAQSQPPAGLLASNKGRAF